MVEAGWEGMVHSGGSDEGAASRMDAGWDAGIPCSGVAQGSRGKREDIDKCAW